MKGFAVASSWLFWLGFLEIIWIRLLSVITGQAILLELVAERRLFHLLFSTSSPMVTHNTFGDCFR